MQDRSWWGSARVEWWRRVDCLAMVFAEKKEESNERGGGGEVKWSGEVG